MRVAIIGAGPIGLEAAAFFLLRNYDVRVYERGTRIADNVASWGHVRLFSPFSLNRSDWGLQVIAESDGDYKPPAEHALLAGREYLESYLKPLSDCDLLDGCIELNTRVVSITKQGLGKAHAIGQASRGKSPFVILLESTDPDTRRSTERTELADVVIDCSGTYGNHRWLGVGGARCPGERRLLSSKDYLLPDILGRDIEQFLGKQTLVVGSGYSAATSIVSLQHLANANAATRVTWVTRASHDGPIPLIEGDTLTERDAIARSANELAVKELATSVNSCVTWLPGVELEAISQRDDGSYEVMVVKGGERETIVVDQILANVGYRPDREMYRELQVHECYASEGPIKLAAALLGETSSDCLAQSAHGADSLKNPEAGFFIIGAKSYGRNSKFLLKLGLQQIQDVGELISRDFQQPGL